MNEWKNNLNSFNSLKVMCWREHFEKIMNDEIPNPVSVTVDSTNKCNLSCGFCHYKKFRNEERKTISHIDLLSLIDIIQELGVKSVCYSGGGEPFLHPSSGEFIRNLKNKNINVGTITNGTLINNFIDDIMYSCRWIGISIDAGTNETYKKIKGSKNIDMFNKVLNNTYQISNFRKDNKHPSIGFKFLIHPYNYYELYIAAKIAKEIGVDDFHARPCYNPGMTWDKKTLNIIELQVKEAHEKLESDNFHIYYITHKFDNVFNKKYNDKCEVTPIAGLTFAADGYCYVCCDLRGENMGRLCKWNDIVSMWGSKKHKEILKNINPKKCPHRCTFGPYQEILENVFRNDCMTYHFP